MPGDDIPSTSSNRQASSQPPPVAVFHQAPSHQDLPMTVTSSMDLTFRAPQPVLPLAHLGLMP